MKKSYHTGGIESTFYVGMFNYTPQETRTEFDIFHQAAMRSLDGVLRLTDAEVEFINNSSDGDAEIDCFGMEIDLCNIAA